MDTLPLSLLIRYAISSAFCSTLTQLLNSFIQFLILVELQNEWETGFPINGMDDIFLLFCS